MKVLEWYEQPVLQRQQAWQKAWEKFVPQKGVMEWTVSKELQSIDAKSLLKELKNHHVTLVDSLKAATLIAALGSAPVEVARSGFIDCLFFRFKSGSWPFAFFRQSLRELIVRRAPSLDLHRTVYVVGTESHAYASVAELIEMGFEKFNVVSRDPTPAHHLMDFFKKNYFKVQIKVLRNADLPLQQNNGALLINTVNLSEDQEMAEDLSYLNFIYSEGVVIDAFIHPKKHLLLEETINVGLKLIEGLEIFGHRDGLIFSNALKEFFQVEVSVSDFMEVWDQAWEGLESK